MPKFPTVKSKQPTISTCGKFIRMGDGAVFKRTILGRGEVNKPNEADNMVEEGLAELDTMNVSEINTDSGSDY